MEDIKIGNRFIGRNHPTYVIAEIGINHQGNINLAKKLIDAVVDAGANCVKFQKRSMPHVYKKDVLDMPEKQEHGVNYILQHVKKCELSEKEFTELYLYSQSKGVDFSATPWDHESLRFLSSLNLPFYKIGSPDMFNLPLIHEAVKLKKPVIISTGMSFLSDIEQLIKFLQENNAQYILLHCNSTYPAPVHEINLEFLPILMSKSSYPVGYSSHDLGVTISLAAVAKGARVIEKHLTLDKALPGPDHKASLVPEELKMLVKEIRTLELALGEAVRYPSRGEFLNRETLSKSLVVNRAMKKGEVIRYENIGIKSPGKGTNPLKAHLFIGRKLIQRDIKKGDYLLESDVNFYHPADLHNLSINHKWGLVARMGDIDELLQHRPSFVEIHLTDSDIRIGKKYWKKYNLPFTIHAPEYNGDSLLDLSCGDEFIRKRSIMYVNKILEYGRTLKRLFTNRDKNIKLILHPGGMSMKESLRSNCSNLNKNLLASLSVIKKNGFEILIENMPPLPWYYGGQWYHSSFMDAEEIAGFSRATGYGIAFDVSHAALYCNYMKKSLEEYVKIILPVTKYVHISDAAKTNAEGLKIGEGTIDFKRILPYLVKTDLWFVPEIWQGHKFGGEDFVSAIRTLKLLNYDF